MYGFAYTTLVANSEKELNKLINMYRSYSFFECGSIRESVGKWKHQGKFMVIVSYFNNK